MAAHEFDLIVIGAGAIGENGADLAVTGGLTRVLGGGDLVRGGGLSWGWRARGERGRGTRQCGGGEADGQGLREGSQVVGREQSVGHDRQRLGVCPAEEPGDLVGAEGIDEGDGRGGQ